MEHIYEQLEGEPDQWYQRFQTFLHLETKRNIDQAFRHTFSVQERKLTLVAKRASGHWRVIAKKWYWETRAKAWDDAQINLRESARSKQVNLQIALEDEDRERKLRDRAWLWVEDYLSGRVKEVRTTTEEKTGHKGVFYKKSTVTVIKQPPQWMLKRFIE